MENDIPNSPEPPIYSELDKVGDPVNPTMRRSRLNKHLATEAKRNFLFTLAGIVILLIFFFTIGLPLLIKASLYIAPKDNTNYLTSKKETVFIDPPVLNPTISATSSAKIRITGSSADKQIIKLYINDDIADTVHTKSDGSFVFENVTLQKGDNVIKAKAQTDDTDKNQSNYSNTIKISYLNEAPDLTVDYPGENQEIKQSSTITVTGKTKPNAQVTINGFRAIVDDSGGFTYTQTLQNGDNTLKVVATDQAGNKTELDRHVRYTP